MDIPLRQAALEADRRHRAQSAPSLDFVACAWQVLVDNGWSLVDQFEHEQRLFLIATSGHEPGNPLARLSQRQQQVCAHASLGKANKAIAQDLGLSEATVATHLREAAAKLGAQSRTDVIRLWGCLFADDAGPTRGGDSCGKEPARQKLELFAFVFGGVLFHAISVASFTETETNLSRAELDVATGILAGESNAQIAERRRSSIHTVANQVAGAFAKLGVRSRSELAAHWSRRQQMGAATKQAPQRPLERVDTKRRVEERDQCTK